MEQIITREYLRSHPNEIFVFGDNFTYKGYGGAAALRDEPNTYGFITKKFPLNDDRAFFTPDEYKGLYIAEIKLLELIIRENIRKNTSKIYLISKLGSGLANKYNIFEEIIEPDIKQRLSKYSNVKFLW